MTRPRTGIPATGHAAPVGVPPRDFPGIPQLPPSGSLVDGDTFRSVLSGLPTGVSVVTAEDDEGAPRGLTCSAVCSVSKSPPLLLVCVDQRSGALRALRSSGGFVVNILKEGRGDISDLFASASADKFAYLEWRPAPRTGLPLLHRDVLAYAECVIATEISAGDHTVVFGAMVGGHGPQPGEGPLLHWNRGYSAWTGDDR